MTLLFTLVNRCSLLRTDTAVRHGEPAAYMYTPEYAVKYNMSERLECVSVLHLFYVVYLISPNGSQLLKLNGKHNATVSNCAKLTLAVVR